MKQKILFQIQQSTLVKICETCWVDCHESMLRYIIIHNVYYAYL